MPTRRVVSAVRREGRTSSACDAHAPSIRLPYASHTPPIRLPYASHTPPMRHLAGIEIISLARAPAALPLLDIFARRGTQQLRYSRYLPHTFVPHPGCATHLAAMVCDHVSRTAGHGARHVRLQGRSRCRGLSVAPRTPAATSRACSRHAHPAGSRPRPAPPPTTASADRAAARRRWSRGAARRRRSAAGASSGRA